MKKRLDFLVRYKVEFQGWQRRSSGKFTICYLVFLRKRWRWAFLNTLPWRGFIEPAVASPPLYPPLKGGEAIFQNIFGCISRMDLIQSAMDKLHLDACFDMLKCWYRMYIEFSRMGWSQKFWWKSSKIWHLKKFLFSIIFKIFFVQCILKRFEICCNNILYHDKTMW